MTTRPQPIPRVTRGARPRVLGPILAELREARAEHLASAQSDGLFALHFLGRQLSVDLWTKDRLDQYFRSASDDVAECARMVAQSVALLAKCELDLERLEQSHELPTGELYEAQAKLMLNAAVGQSLVSDIQRVIDELLKGGVLEEARNLSGFHHRLRNAVADVRSRVGDEYRSSLQSLTERMKEPAVTVTTEPARPTEVEAPPARVAGPTAPAPRRARSPVPTPIRYPQRTHRVHRPGGRPARARPVRSIPHAKAPPPHVGNSPGWWRTGMLAAMLALTLIPLAAIRRSALVSATAQAAPATDAVPPNGTVQEIRDRWPSAFVVVSTEAWDELGEAERLEVVRDLATRLAPSRYEGALVTNQEGRPLAQWMRSGGASLLEGEAEQDALRASAGAGRTGNTTPKRPGP